MQPNLPNQSSTSPNHGALPSGTPSVHRETRIETASDSEVDSTLRSLTKRTSIEELTRAGKTRNLKTLSERDLKEWIKEALRKVITSTTTLGEVEREQLLRATRTELTAIMIARQADDHAHADDAHELAALTSERDDLTARLATTEATGSGRVADLKGQLVAAIARRDTLAARVAEFESRLAAALAAAAAESSDLRGQLGARDAKDVKLGITRDEAQRVAHEVMARLVEKHARTLADTVALTDRIAAADGANADLDRRRGDAERRAAHAEAKLTAQSAEAAASATRAKENEQAGATQRAGSAAQLKDAETARARLIDELADARAATAAEQEQLASALRAVDKHAARTLADTVALTDRIAAADGANADLDRRRGDAERRAAHAEAKLTAQSAEAAASATRAKENEQAGATQRAGSAAQLKDAETARARLIDELADARAATAAEQEQLASALRAAAETSVAAEQRARLAGETLAAAERQLQRSADELQAAETNRLGAEQGLNTVEDARAALASERDRLAAALAAADVARSGVDGRLRAVEGERDDARRAAAAATKRAANAETAAERLAAAPPKASLPSDITVLQNALTRARSVVTDRDGEPREDVGGDLVARKPGRWLTAWRDAKGRLKAARTVGDHWLNAGRMDGIDPAIGLASEPVILAHADRVLAAWRDADGHARLATLDETGRLQTGPRDLGPALAAPGLSRGGGTAPTFVVTTDHAGHVQLHEADGSAPIDLTARLAAPPAAGAAAAWHWPLEGSRHVAYRDAEGAVHEYLELKGRWFHAAIGTRTGAPAAAADPIGYAPGDHEHVVYLGVDGHIHELCFDAIEWHHSDLTASAAAPAAAGRPAGAYVAGRHCVVFRGVDGKAHCLRLRRDWRHILLADLGAISEDPHLGTSGGEGAVSCRGADGQRRWARFSDPKVIVIADLPG